MKSFILSSLVILTSIQAKAQLQYPPAKEIPVVDKYHGVEIADPYQWLELENSKDVKEWTEAQNDVSEKYLNRMIRSTRTESQMNRFMFRKTGKYEGKRLSPAAENKYYYTLYYHGLEGTPSLFYRKGFRGKDPEVLRLVQGNGNNVGVVPYTGDSDKGVLVEFHEADVIRNVQKKGAK